MKQLFWHLTKAAPVFIGLSFLTIQNVSASPLKPPSSNNESGAMDQITSVSELRDVQPTEWAYEALRSLVERYGCIVGYPDSTYRGNRALTRWEFAAGVNACMNTIERLIQENVAVLKEDVDTLKRLAQEFEAELAALGGRVDNLESRVSFLEDHQFSTTTKLNGEVIFAVSDTFGEPIGENDDSTQTTFSDRVRLNLDTSFTGEDRLRTRLQASTVPRLSGATGTDMARLAFDAGSAFDDNNVVVDDLYYRFPVGESITAWVGTSGMDLDDVFDPVNPYLSDSGTGALSRFSRYNPTVYRGPQGAGVGIKYAFGDFIDVTALYLSDVSSVSNPDEGRGLFNGSYSAGVQVGISPLEEAKLALTYIHSYQPQGLVDLFGSTGSQLAKQPFGDEPTTADRFGVQGSWQVIDQINLAAWGGYILAHAQDGPLQDNKADLWTWNANLSVVDLGKEGAVLSFGGGLMPRAAYVEGGESDPNASYIIEAAYKFPVTDNIIITPGGYVILDPEGNNNNGDIWVGVIRTTFKF
jgi:hypothetical protein